MTLVLSECYEGSLNRESLVESLLRSLVTHCMGDGQEV